MPLHFLPQHPTNMRKHIPHPISQNRTNFGELHILYGGNERQTIEESLALARDLRDALHDDERILYVNLLISNAMLEHAMGKRFDHGARRSRNEFVTYSHRDIINKLEFLTKTIATRDASYVILNGFELAALNPRHRVEFMGWIKELRNSNVNVIVFTLNCPGHYGTLGSLGFMASTIEEVGQYLAKDAKQRSATTTEAPLAEQEASVLTPAIELDEVDVEARIEEILAETAEEGPEETLEEAANFGSVAQAPTRSTAEVVAERAGTTVEELSRFNPSLVQFLAELDRSEAEFLQDDHIEDDPIEDDPIEEELLEGEWIEDEVIEEGLIDPEFTEAEFTDDRSIAEGPMESTAGEYSDSGSLETNDLALQKGLIYLTQRRKSLFFNGPIVLNST